MRTDICENSEGRKARQNFAVGGNSSGLWRPFSRFMLIRSVEIAHKALVLPLLSIKGRDDYCLKGSSKLQTGRLYYFYYRN
ncbi:MAG: hypothetical protein DU429_03990 [Candidatus Tokpelaia sp.]|nr:MAG: hypothetical protein DU430_06385 [Candidatus Tokpelaia sp.]KAA6207019.1 MAG: hypothetical protein DU429_03990 [Candidatus Tokpelaia sp.]